MNTPQWKLDSDTLSNTTKDARKLSYDDLFKAYDTMATKIETGNCTVLEYDMGLIYEREVNKRKRDQLNVITKLENDIVQTKAQLYDIGLLNTDRIVEVN